MATWVDPIDSQTDPDAPLTSELGKRWDNNVVSFVEQDSTSPVNEAAYHPYNKVTVGDSNDGLVYDGAVDGTVTSIVSPSIDAGYRYLIEWRNIGGVSGPFPVTVSFYTSGDVLIESVVTSSSAGSGNIASGHLDFISEDYWRGSFVNSTKSDSVVGYFKMTGTNFNAGKVYLRRRKELL